MDRPAGGNTFPGSDVAGRLGLGAKAARGLEKHRLFKHIPEPLMDGMEDILLLAVRSPAARHGQEQVARVAENDLQSFDHEDVIEGYRGKCFEAWVIHEQDPDVGDRHPRSPLWLR